MLSLRAIARAAPRNATRFASITSRTSLRPTFQTSIRAATRPSIATFSTSRSRFDEYSQQLAAKLTSEIDLESEESSAQTGSDSNVQQFRDENPDWSIEDTEGEQEILMRRKFDDEDITVQFSIADFNNPMMPMDDMDGALADEEDMDVQSHGGNTKGAINAGRTSGNNFKQMPEDSVAPADREEFQEEDDIQPSYAVGVNVLVQRPGSKGALKFNLVADNGEFIIQQLTHIPAAQASGNAADILRNSSEALYAGPPFQQLDEEVQGLLENYLNARGITSYLATFIPDYVDVKEQKEYLGWLGRVKDFVE